MSGVIDKYLQIRVGIIVFLGLEAERHTQLSIQETKIGLCTTSAVVAGSYALVAIVIIAPVICRVLAGLDGHVLSVENTAAGHTGAPRLTALGVG